MNEQAVFQFPKPKRRPQRPYYATTPLSREQLAGAMRVAEQQDELVLAIFRAEQRALSPSQVWEIGKHYGKTWLLTSVRRSITNLADPECGVLVHLSTYRMGPYGKPEGLWVLPEKQAAA